MPFTILLTEDALRDLEKLHRYISAHDSPAKANQVLGQVKKAVSGLAKLPKRGIVPMELGALGIQDYWEVFFKPYRIIYRVIGDAVYVYLITDGRRDMQSLLQRRLLG